MALRPFSVVGEALHFSTRRFETVMRVSALPISLLLIFNMAATFLYLSVANNRVITFADVARAGVSWAQATRLAGRAAQSGLNAGSTEVWMIYGALLLINAILVASFMAPLIRYAGLGEKPGPGVLRAPFGADQVRFVLAGVLSVLVFGLVVYAPINVALIAIAGFITQAMTVPYARFPETASLHTIDIIPGAEAFGLRFFHQYQVWGVGAALVSALVIALLILHLRPKGPDRTAGVGFPARALSVTGGVIVYLIVCLFLYVNAVKFLAGLSAMAGGQPNPGALSPDALGVILFFSAVIAFAGFFSLRLFPYAGIAVCRRSMSLKGAFRATRRHDILRLALAFVVLGVILFGVEILLIWLGGGAAFAVFGYLASAVESYARLIGGADAGKWVFPFFGWLWAVTGVLFTIIWTAFTYGVSAGLWGRLYRESVAD
jgi:hypothetical protein